MSEIGITLLEVLTASDNARGRSSQKNIGPSEVGGCRRRVYYRTHGQPHTNQSLRLAAIMGTAIHNTIEKAFYRTDPFGEKYVLEMEVSYENLTGHIDLYLPEKKELVDWKTTTKKNLKNFPTREQKMQVHLYAYLLLKNDKAVETVTLVGIARDGDERDIKVYSAPYDEDIAKEGLYWLAELKTYTEPPAPEKYASFCALYCNFYDESGNIGCKGISK